MSKESKESTVLGIVDPDSRVQSEGKSIEQQPTFPEGGLQAWSTLTGA